MVLILLSFVSARRSRLWAPCGRILPRADVSCPAPLAAPAGLSELARRLRTLSVMTQARNAILHNFSDLTGRLESPAGQKARGGWQALPGALAMEARACL
jgi:hypothetical protein